jgi:hypothetical protein
MNDLKTHTLFGGIKVEVILEDGTKQEWTIRQIKVREYQVAFRLIDDEPGLMAIACDVKRPAVETLSPESYSTVYSTMQEVNQGGFFIFAGRQKERAAEMLERLPAELVAQAMLANRSTSLTPSPLIPPPRG